MTALLSVDDNVRGGLCVSDLELNDGTGPGSF